MNKKAVIVTILFLLGLYHLLMCLTKINAFNMNEDSLKLFKHILTRIYHLDWALLVGFGFSFKWSRIYNWIWLYLGSKIIYNILTFSPEIKTALNKSLLDGFYLATLIIAILLILTNEEDR